MDLTKANLNEIKIEDNELVDQNENSWKRRK